MGSMTQKAIPLNIGVAGFYNLKVVRPDGSVRRELEFENLIVDQGLDFLFDCPDFAFGLGYWSAKCQVSTSSVTPVVTDDTLDSFVATANATDGVDQPGTRTYVPGTPYAYNQISRTYRFGTGAAAGVLAKIAVLPTNAGNSIFSATLIKDGGGSPTTVEVLADEILDVTYTVRFYYLTTDVVFSVFDGATEYGITARPANLSSSNTIHTDLGTVNTCSVATYATQVLGAVTSTPAGSPMYTSAGGFSWNTYTIGSFTRTATLTIGASDSTGNIGSATFISRWLGYQFSFAPVIPKIAGKILSLRFVATISRFTPP